MGVALRRALSDAGRFANQRPGESFVNRSASDSASRPAWQAGPSNRMDSLGASVPPWRIHLLRGFAPDAPRFRADIRLYGNARQFLAIGHAPHFGLRATHSVAPKSISA
jgi:hypothetical protein